MMAIICQRMSQRSRFNRNPISTQLRLWNILPILVSILCKCSPHPHPRLIAFAKIISTSWFSGISPNVDREEMKGNCVLKRATTCAGEVVGRHVSRRTSSCRETKAAKTVGDTGCLLYDGWVLKSDLCAHEDSRSV